VSLQISDEPTSDVLLMNGAGKIQDSQQGFEESTLNQALKLVENQIQGLT